MALINFSGIASGIDSSALIQALLDQRREATITPLDNQLTQLRDTNSSFDEIKKLLSSLQTAAGSFRAINGGAITKNATSSDESAVSAVASNAASSGSHTITVSTLAKNATQSFDDRFASGSSAINSSINNGALEADRTVSYTIGSGSEQETVEITLTDTTTATEFVNTFNSNSTKATASLVNTGTSSSPSYAIVISSKSQGLSDGEINVTVGSEITTAGTGAFSSSSLEQATDAELTISGIAGTITRSTNTISDVIDGLTLNLIATGSATVTVSNDSQATSDSVEEFVTAFNDLVDYIKENDQVTQEQDGGELTNVFGSLASTSLDENILSTLRSALSGSSNTSGIVRIMADLGVTTERDGTLKFDADVFAEAMAKDPSGVMNLTEQIGEELASVTGVIAQFTRFNGLVDQTVNANKSQIDQITKRIEDLEKYLAREQESLTARYARLESIVGQMTSQQNALAGLLPT